MWNWVNFVLRRKNVFALRRPFSLGLHSSTEQRLYSYTHTAVPDPRSCLRLRKALNQVKIRQRLNRNVVSTCLQLHQLPVAEPTRVQFSLSWVQQHEVTGVKHVEQKQLHTAQTTGHVRSMAASFPHTNTLISVTPISYTHSVMLQLTVCRATQPRGLQM